MHGFLCHSFKFLSKTVTSKPLILPSRIVACTFSDNLSQNNCLLLCFIGHCCNLTSSVGPCYSLVFFFHSLISSCHVQFMWYVHVCVIEVGELGSNEVLLVLFSFLWFLWVLNLPHFAQNCYLFLILVGKCISTLAKLFCHKWANFDGLYFI